MNALNDIIEERQITIEGCCMIKQYRKGRFLGKGAFADCYEVTEIDTGKTFAAKIINKKTLLREVAREKFANEIIIHRSMKHKNIVHFEKYFEDQNNEYIIMELCQNRSLKELVRGRKKLNEVETRFFMMQIIEGVEYIHSKDVIHRDLKLGNLLLGRNMQLKIGDFGLAIRIDSGERRMTICGTPNYIAPEVLNAKVCGYSFGCDIWSIGVIFYTMLIGKTPFETKNLKTTYNKIRTKDYAIPDEAKVTDDAKDLISKLLTVNPNRRLSLESILTHPFMIKNSIPNQIPETVLTTPLLYDPMINKPKSAENLYKSSSAKKRIKERVEVKKCSNENMFKTRKSVPKCTKCSLKENNPVKLSLRRCTPKKSSHGKLDKVSVYFTATNKAEKSPKFRVDSNMIKKLPTNLRRSVVSTSPTTIRKTTDIDYVLYYQNYVHKYGFGYLLTNGRIGFYFNDMTNILWLENKQKYGYYDFYMKGKCPEITYITDLDNNNKDIEKKLKIFTWFKSHCEDYMKNNEEEIVITDTNNEISVKRFIRMKRGLLLRLTNGIMQMLFDDNTQIAICMHTKKVVYINKNKEKQCVNIENEDFKDLGEDLIERYKYVLDAVNFLRANKKVPVKHYSKEPIRKEMH